MRDVRSTLDRRLLRDNLRLAPSQPATALWRAIELGHLLRSAVLPVEGRGLDLGCGDGRITTLVRAASKARWELVGIDPDPGEVAHARELGVYEAVYESEGASMQLDDRTFDFVFSNSVLEHIDALDATLRELGRVLKPAGLLVFTVPSQFFPDNLGAPGVLAQLATGTHDVMSYRAAIDRRLAHKRYLTIDQWRALLNDAGLLLRSGSFYMSRAETRRWALLSNLTSGLLVRVLGRGRSPLELQRYLGLRRRSAPVWLRMIGEAIGQVGALGLTDGHGSEARGSGLLVVAQKVNGPK